MDSVGFPLLVFGNFLLFSQPKTFINLLLFPLVEYLYTTTVFINILTVKMGSRLGPAYANMIFLAIFYGFYIQKALQNYKIK